MSLAQLILRATALLLTLALVTITLSSEGRASHRRSAKSALPRMTGSSRSNYFTRSRNASVACHSLSAGAHSGVRQHEQGATQMAPSSLRAACSLSPRRTSITSFARSIRPPASYSGKQLSRLQATRLLPPTKSMADNLW